MTPITREEIAAEAWFGDQRERVLELLDERDAAWATRDALSWKNAELVKTATDLTETAQKSCDAEAKAQAEVARLRDELKCATDALAITGHDKDVLKGREATLAQEVETLRAALGPFAARAARLDGYAGEQRDRLVQIGIRADDCEAARTALASPSTAAHVLQRALDVEHSNAVASCLAVIEGSRAYEPIAAALAERDERVRHDGEATGRDDARRAVVDILVEDVQFLAGEKKWQPVFAAIAARDERVRAEERAMLARDPVSGEAFRRLSERSDALEAKLAEVTAVAEQFVMARDEANRLRAQLAEVTSERDATLAANDAADAEEKTIRQRLETELAAAQARVSSLFGVVKTLSSKRPSYDALDAAARAIEDAEHADDVALREFAKRVIGRKHNNTIESDDAIVDAVLKGDAT